MNEGKRFRLKRTRKTVRPGELQAELWALRPNEWALIGVLQLTEEEWADLAELTRAVGFEVNQVLFEAES